MPEEPRDEDKFVEEVFGSIRTKSSTRLVKEFTDAESDEESAEESEEGSEVELEDKGDVPEITGDESDEALDHKLEILEDKLVEDKLPRAEPAPCVKCGIATPYRCKKCHTPICKTHFFLGRFPLCGRCWWRTYTFVLLVAISSGIIGGTVFFWINLWSLLR